MLEHVELTCWDLGWNYQIHPVIWQPLLIFYSKSMILTRFSTSVTFASPSLQTAAKFIYNVRQTYKTSMSTPEFPKFSPPRFTQLWERGGVRKTYIGGHGEKVSYVLSIYLFITTQQKNQRPLTLGPIHVIAVISHLITLLWFQFYFTAVFISCKWPKMSWTTFAYILCCCSRNYRKDRYFKTQCKITEAERTCLLVTTRTLLRVCVWAGVVFWCSF